MVLGAQAPGRVGRRRITSGGPRERPSFVFPPLGCPRVELRPPDPPLQDELDRAAAVARPGRAGDRRRLQRPGDRALDDRAVAVHGGGRARVARSVARPPGRRARRRSRSSSATSGELAAAITLWLHGRIGELGYWAAPDFRGRGYVPRAVRLLCAWALRRARPAAGAARDVPRQRRVGAGRREVRLHAGGRAALVAGAAGRAPRRDDVVAAYPATPA